MLRARRSDAEADLMLVEPVPDSPAAVATTAKQRLLIVADFHAGIEAVLRADGVELDDNAASRRSRLLGLLESTTPDRLVILGDLVHSIGEPWSEERAELTALFEAIDLPVTVVKGNHDGEIEPLLERIDHPVSVADSGGVKIGAVGLAHGHTWPDGDLLDADVLCIGHEHPVARLTDEVGGRRHEQVWLRGQLDPTPFEQSDQLQRHGDALGGSLVVFPAFNDLSGGTWVNADEQTFLSPFLPDGLKNGEAYLLDGTRLGEYSRL